MKLSKLYSNKPDIFGPIDFIGGLNTVIAEIRLPENKAKDTHNLGKTTLWQGPRFLLSPGQGHKNFSSSNILDRFREFVFYLEIELCRCFISDGAPWR